MISWADLLATLYWRRAPVSLNDYLEMSLYAECLNQPSHLVQYPLRPQLREWLFDHQDWWERGRRELNWCLKNNTWWLHPQSELYPQALRNLAQPPLLLTVKGSSRWLQCPCLSVVGSRQPSQEALDWMEAYFSAFLKDVDHCVVSGGARGIDQKAHFLALRNQRLTVCFLPSGLAYPYPQSWVKWEKDFLSKGGVMVSSFSPFQKIQKSHFHVRNELIVAVSSAVFVVEAKRRSGSMMTAKLAATQGKAVCTLPVSPMKATGQGSLDLLFDGAFLLRDDIDLRGVLALNAGV